MRIDARLKYIGNTRAHVHLWGGRRQIRKPLRDVLKAKGYVLHYSEVYADDELIHWQRILPDALITILAGN